MSDDPITLEIIQNLLQAAADEMFAAMRNTAISSIIYEVLDMGTGITDSEGRIASSGADIPAFVGVLEKSAQFILGKFGADVKPGDIFIANDPWHGGVTHLNDLVLAMPVIGSAPSGWKVWPSKLVYQHSSAPWSASWRLAREQRWQIWESCPKARLNCPSRRTTGAPTMSR